jgi:hypothetical protein
MHILCVATVSLFPAQLRATCCYPVTLHPHHHHITHSSHSSNAIGPTAVPCAAARHVLEVLEPLSVEHGGPLLLQHVSYVEGRGNIIVEYPGEPDGGVISFVGAHLVSSIG